MIDPLTLKLERLCGLGPSDGLGRVRWEPLFVAAHCDILSEGQVVPGTKLLLSGTACQYKRMRDGQRAITGFLLPGDFTNPPMPERQRLDHSVAALTRCEIADVPMGELRSSGGNGVHYALDLCMMIESAIKRAWLANIGQRPADRRMAHLLCELRHRLAVVDLADSHGFHLALVQQDLADALGLSPVHVNRVLQQLKQSRLLSIRERTFQIADLGRLEAFAQFDPAYLYVGDHLTASMPSAEPIHSAEMIALGAKRPWSLHTHGGHPRQIA